MVLRGQDAWRKHPLLSGCWKAPLPGLGIAVGLFVGYVFIENMFHIAMTPPPSPHKTRYAFEKSGTGALKIGDSMPEGVRKINGGH